MAWVDDVGWVEDTPPAPASYEEQVAMAQSWGVPANEIASIVGTPQSVAANNQAQAQSIYELTGSAPSWATPVYNSPSTNADTLSVGGNQAGIGSFEQDQINALNKNQITFNAAPPSWLNPADYVANNFAAPYTQQQITGQVDPSWIRQMNGQTYASVKGPSDLSGGEYLIDPNTGKFLLDKNGNPIGVTYPKSNNFDDWATTPAGQFSLLMTPLLAMGGVAAVEGLGALGAGAGAAEGAGALTTADILGSTGFTPVAGANFGIIPGATYTAGGLTVADILASGGFTPVEGASFTVDPNAAYTTSALANAAASGLTASQIASALKTGLSVTKGLTGSGGGTSGINSALLPALSKLAQGQSGYGMEVPGIVRTNTNPFYNTPQVALQTPQKTEMSTLSDLLRQGKSSWQT